MGNRGAELEAVAFSIPTLYAITSKLPFTMGDKVYDIEESGKHKLKKILNLISKARVKASARSTDQANNTSTGNIISSHLTSPTFHTLSLAALPAATPMAAGTPTTPTHKYESWATLCGASGTLYPSYEDIMISTQYTSPQDFKTDAMGRNHSDCRICKHLEISGNHRSYLYESHFSNFPTHCPRWAEMDFENRAKIIKEVGICTKCLNPKYTSKSKADRTKHIQRECSVASRKRKNKYTCLNEGTKGASRTHGSVRTTLTRIAPYSQHTRRSLSRRNRHRAT